MAPFVLLGEGLIEGLLLAVQVARPVDLALDLTKMALESVEWVVLVLE